MNTFIVDCSLFSLDLNMSLLIVVHQEQKHSVKYQVQAWDQQRKRNYRTDQITHRLSPPL